MKKKKYLFIFSIIFLFLTSCTGGNNLDAVIPSIPVDNDGAVSRTPQSLVTGEKNVIIRNKRKHDSEGYEETGVWGDSILAGYKGEISRFSNDPLATAIYTSNDLGDSRYCISVYKINHPNTSRSVVYDIFDGSEQLDSIVLNHSLPYGTSDWVNLGEFTFTQGQESRVIISRGTEDSNILRADDVRFKRISDSTDCYGQTYVSLKKSKVIDTNYDEVGDTGKRIVNGYREFGEWEQSIHKGFKDSTSRYSDDEFAYVTYSFMPESSQYCLSVFKVTHPSSVAKAKISIFQEGSEIYSTYLNYSLPVERSGWESLGKHGVESNKRLDVIIEREAQDIGLLRADAVKFYMKDTCD